jgi:hypothetical protein
LPAPESLGIAQLFFDRKTLFFLLPNIVFIGTVFGMEYFYANAAIAGRVRSGEYPFAIGVLMTPDDRMPRGIALEVGCTADGLAKWKLKVHGVDVPGRFFIEDRRFVPVEEGWG